MRFFSTIDITPVLSSIRGALLHPTFLTHRNVLLHTSLRGGSKEDVPAFGRRCSWDEDLLRGFLGWEKLEKTPLNIGEEFSGVSSEKLSSIRCGAQSWDSGTLFSPVSGCKDINLHRALAGKFRTILLLSGVLVMNESRRTWRYTRTLSTFYQCPFTTRTSPRGKSPDRKHLAF